LKFYDFLGFENIYGTLGGRTTEYKKPANTEKKTSEKQLTAYYYLVHPLVMK
jgi:hypothetical protein